MTEKQFEIIHLIRKHIYITITLTIKTPNLKSVNLKKKI